MSTNETVGPSASCTLHNDGSGEVSVGGVTTVLDGVESDRSSWAQALDVLAPAALSAGGSLLVRIESAGQVWGVIVKGDGTAEAVPLPIPLEQEITPEPEPPAALSWLPGTQFVPAPQAHSGPPPRVSFIEPKPDPPPPAYGWRSFMAKMGAPISPSEAELAERRDIELVSQRWPGPRTVVMVNGKGGAGKTPTTICLSAVFARYGGAGVLAWDNNQTRGTLGWRTEQGPHEATLLDLLPQVEFLMSAEARVGDMARFVHHQSWDQFDVLRSQPVVLAAQQRLTGADVDALWSVGAKFYRLLMIDSGNDESDPMWLAMVDHADQLVVATTTRDDHAEAAALLLEALSARDERSANLAAHSVVVVSQADPRAPAEVVDRVRSGLASLCRASVAIPYDPALVDGKVLFESLRPKTRRAWLSAGAAVAAGL